MELHEALAGDVWICAGHSNMQFGLVEARNGAEEIKNAEHPEVRFCVVRQQASYARAEVPRGSWKIVSPANVPFRTDDWPGVRQAR